MNDSSFIRPSALRRSVIALSLLLAAMGAPGTNATANAEARYSTFTPAALVSSLVPAYAGEVIRAVRQPGHILLPPPWVAVAAGVLLVTGSAAWRWIRRGKFLQMPPHEIALQYLDDIRRLTHPKHARAHCRAVSKVIRRYIEERFAMRAPQATTTQFLRDLAKERETALGLHRALLEAFLRRCDQARLAKWRCSVSEVEAVHRSARRFVQQTAFAPSVGRANGDPQAAKAKVSSARAQAVGRARSAIVSP